MAKTRTNREPREPRGMLCWALGPPDVDGWTRFCKERRGHKGACVWRRDRKSRLRGAV